MVLVRRLLTNVKDKDKPKDKDKNQKTKTHRRTGRGARGAAAPPNFGQIIFFGQQEKIWEKAFFKDISVFFFISLKRQIFSILIWSQRNNPVTFSRKHSQWLLSTWWVSGYREGYHLLIYIFIVFYCWALYCTALHWLECALSSRELIRINFHISF